MFKLNYINKKTYAQNMAFKEHSGSSQRNNIISHTLKVKHLERQTHAVNLSFCICHLKALSIQQA